MSKLDNLMYYYNSSRRAGHTTLMLEGLDYDRPAYILFANVSHARMAFNDVLRKNPTEDISPAELRYKKVRFITISVLRNLEFMRGLQPSDLKPMILDHFALQQLYAEHNKELEQK